MVKRLAVFIYAQHRMASAPYRSQSTFISMNIFHCVSLFLVFLFIISSYTVASRPLKLKAKANNKSANKLPNKILQCIILYDANYSFIVIAIDSMTVSCPLTQSGDNYIIVSPKWMKQHVLSYNFAQKAHIFPSTRSISARLFC